jgi:Flp pilus assembly secretin CpaC
MKKLSATTCLVAALLSASVLMAGCGGGDEVRVGGPFFTTAPADLTLNAGSTATYKVSGGMPLYSAATGNANIARVALDGPNLVITAVAPGTTTITVQDAMGTIVVTTLRVQG